MSDFRKEIFSLCRLAGEISYAKQLQEAESASRAVAPKSNSGISVDIRQGSLSFLLTQGSSEFYDCLYFDENLGSLGIIEKAMSGHLSKSERELVETGHQTLAYLVDRCLDEISEKFPNIAKAMSPYFFRKEIKRLPTSIPALKKQDIEEVVSAFRNGEVYKTFIQSDIPKIFDTFPSSAIAELFWPLKKSINASMGGAISKDIDVFMQRMQVETPDVETVLLGFAILADALSRSLKIACRLLFKAMCGYSFPAFTNDCIIRFEGSTRGAVCSTSKFLVQLESFDFAGFKVNDLAVIDCQPSDSMSIKEFGELLSGSISFGSEFGNTGEFLLASVDEELNPIQPLTSAICQSELSAIQVDLDSFQNLAESKE